MIISYICKCIIFTYIYIYDQITSGAPQSYIFHYLNIFLKNIEDLKNVSKSTSKGKSVYLGI